VAVIARWMALFPFESALASGGRISLSFGSPARLLSHPADLGATDGATDPIAAPALHKNDVTLWTGQCLSANHQCLYYSI